MSFEPVGGQEGFSPALGIVALAEEVVVAQSVLRDGNRVVLRADVSPIVKQWNTGGIERAAVVGLLGESHVIGAEFGTAGPRIFLRRLVPEAELARPPEQVGAENATVIVESGQAESEATFILRDA